MTTLYPSVEAMQQHTGLLKLFTPLDYIDRIMIAPLWTDEIEIKFWRGRILDGRRVTATFAGLNELPRDVPIINLGQLS